MCSSDDDCGADTGRRTFLAGSASLAIAGVTGPALSQAVPTISTPVARPPTRVLDDPLVTHGRVVFTHNAQPTIDGYLARPKAPGRYPPVIVISGNLITEEYIPNTCAALALAGYAALAPNLFHVVPDGAQSTAEVVAASANHSEDDVLQDLISGMDYLRKQDFVRRGGFGVLGFCSGGRRALALGARSREIDSVVAYHPAPAPVLAEMDLSRLRSPILLHCGTIDGNISVSDITALATRLKAQQAPTELYLYEGADHGFLAYTRPQRYHPAAAILSWQRTIAFLNRTLGNTA